MKIRPKKNCTPKLPLGTVAVIYNMNGWVAGGTWWAVSWRGQGASEWATGRRAGHGVRKGGDRTVGESADGILCGWKWKEDIVGQGRDDCRVILVCCSGVVVKRTLWRYLSVKNI